MVVQPIVSNACFQSFCTQGWFTITDMLIHEDSSIPNLLSVKGFAMSSSIMQMMLWVRADNSATQISALSFAEPILLPLFSCCHRCCSYCYSSLCRGTMIFRSWWCARKQLRREKRTIQSALDSPLHNSVQFSSVWPGMNHPYTALKNHEKKKKYRTNSVWERKKELIFPSELKAVK